MRRIACVLAVAAVLCASGWAFADGGFFAFDPAQAVREPDQKALLWLRNGRETLILQVKYAGNAADFGWVVPVPSRPKLSTAPGKIFYELASITRPEVVGHAEGNRAGPNLKGDGEPGVPAVTVVEQAQVGPYDATVLAASDPRALAEWLRQHKYAMPAGAPRVLESYVARGWYYVALRVDPARAQADFLAKLRQIDPGIPSLNEAPGRIAETLLRETTADPAAGKKHARVVGETLAALSGGVGPDISYGIRLLDRETQPAGYGPPYDYESLIASDPLADRDAPEHVWQSMVNSTAREFGERRFLAVTAAAGLPRAHSTAEFGRQLRRAIVRDLREGVPFARSNWKRWKETEFKLKLGVDEPYWLAKGREQWEAEYRNVQSLAAACRSGPPLDEGYIRRGLPGRGAFDQLDLTHDLVMVALHRRTFYDGVRRAVSATSRLLATALSSGTIAPLRLEFASKELVYPLRLSSLNPGATDIQLYVLADHRMKTAGHQASFRGGLDTAFAGRLDAAALQGHPEVAKLTGPGRDYLTQLRAKVQAADMNGDIWFARTWTNRPFRQRVDSSGRPVKTITDPTRMELAVLALAVALLIGIRVGCFLQNRRARRGAPTYPRASSSTPPDRNG